MASREYWRIFVEETIPEMGVTLTDGQREEILDAIIGHADMECEATGLSVASANRYADIQRETDAVKMELKFEKEKTACKQCRGTGDDITYGGSWRSISTCYACRGTGKVHPSGKRAAS